MKRQTIAMVSLLVMIGLGLVGCHPKESTIAVKRRYVKVMQPGKTVSSKEHVFNGQLKEKREVDVAFKVGGQVLEILVDEGDYVKEGQTIARMDKRDYKIRLQSATAQFNQMKGEYERYQQLYDKKKLPVNTLEKLKAGYLAAESGYEAATNALNDTELKAPFSGFIYHKNIDKFENVNPGQPIVTLIDVSELEVNFSLSESQVQVASNFDRITCDVPNANLNNIPASFLSMNEKSNGNDMFDVRLMIANPQKGGLKPGMSARVRVVMPQNSDALIKVPVESIFYKVNSPYVWIYDATNSTVKSRKVTIGNLAQQGYVSVSKGLKQEDQVVTAGIHTLTEDQQVKILNNKKL
ncbi:MAG: efflux RND transporter periplasmic adaptor subunit [Marinilabiliaceae bacterium]|nr:efflux RND transporter periplasmic adaptor subunit [Marinilabiliaceae bacterium]